MRCNMNLNKLPLDFDEDFLDAFDVDYVTGNPTFCIQVSTFAEIPQPDEEHVNQQISEEVPTVSKIRLSFEQARTNTSRRSAITREMQKVQFVCNKEGFGWKRRVAQLVDVVTCYSDNDEAEEDSTQEEEDEQGENRKKFDEWATSSIMYNIQYFHVYIEIKNSHEANMAML
ncbi:unnamed protein product [Miscanthus lutarioriparius]|uniref:Uncharacterized protein n=1 Tax=Miscanthus lutarioriparius TaxID=422564 RepID=A0A811SEF7_9POAL|nr:unnamed protein product [Miscanthus lutarioriparius]